MATSAYILVASLSPSQMGFYLGSDTRKKSVKAVIKLIKTNAGALQRETESGATVTSLTTMSKDKVKTLLRQIEANFQPSEEQNEQISF